MLAKAQDQDRPLEPQHEARGSATGNGGTGFLGRRIVRHLRTAGASVRIASRHPNCARAQFGNADPELEAIAADVHSEALVARAVADAYGVVNAVSLYVERGNETFPSVHVRAAERVTPSTLAGRRAARPCVWDRRRPDLRLTLYAQPR